MSRPLIGRSSTRQPATHATARTSPITTTHITGHPRAQWVEPAPVGCGVGGHQVPDQRPRVTLRAPAVCGSGSIPPPRLDTTRLVKPTGPRCGARVAWITLRRLLSQHGPSTSLVLLVTVDNDDLAAAADLDRVASSREISRRRDPSDRPCRAVSGRQPHAAPGA